MRVWISTDLGPHVLKLGRDEAALVVEYARVGAVFVGVDHPNVDAPKRVRKVAKGGSERVSTIGAPSSTDQRTGLAATSWRGS